MSELSSVVADRLEWLPLSLVRREYSVTILEAFEASRDPRAATIHASTLEMLHSLGLADSIKQGLLALHFNSVTESRKK